VLNNAPNQILHHEYMYRYSLSWPISLLMMKAQYIY